MSGKDTKKTATIAENGALAKDGRGFPVRKIFFVLLILLVLCTAALLVANMFIDSYFDKMTMFDGKWELDTAKMNSMTLYKDNHGYFSKEEAYHKAYNDALINHAQTAVDVVEGENVYNYALFGVDHFEGEESGKGVDVVMIISINTEKEQVTYVAMESRMLVYIPGVGVGPMKHAYLLGGPQLLVNTIEQNYGLKLNGFFDLNMSAFTELVDTFGGIKLNGDNALVEKINADIALFNEAKGLSGDSAVESVKLEDGKIKLKGEQIIAYMRNAGADRAAIANEVMAQLTAKISDEGFGGLTTTFDIAVDKMVVSIDRDDVTELVFGCFSAFENVKNVSVGKMEGNKYFGIDAFTCNYKAERDALIKALY